MSLAFKWSTRRKNSSEPVWMTDWIRGLIRICRAIFRIQGRSQLWKEKKGETTKIIREKKEKFNDMIFDKSSPMSVHRGISMQT